MIFFHFFDFFKFFGLIICSGEKNGINVEAALTKILPHFMRKFPKALKMLNSLFRLKSQEIDLDLALGILFQLYCNMDMLETSDDWKYFHSTKKFKNFEEEKFF